MEYRLQTGFAAINRIFRKKSMEYRMEERMEYRYQSDFRLTTSKPARRRYSMRHHAALHAESQMPVPEEIRLIQFVASFLVPFPITRSIGSKARPFFFAASLR